MEIVEKYEDLLLFLFSVFFSTLTLLSSSLLSACRPDN